MIETLCTKATRIAPNLYGCRVMNALNKKVIVELQVPKDQIGDAFFDMLRTLDKMGVDSNMAKASRHRQKGKCVSAKYIWH